MSGPELGPRLELALHEARRELVPFLRRLNLEHLSKHNKGYLAYAEDPVRWFVDAEMNNYIRILSAVSKILPVNTRIIDIGFFIPVIPIALAKLGFHVSSVEKLAFYDRALDEIISFVTQTYDVTLYDLDILQDSIDFIAGGFDVVILSAILEHLNGTPRYLLDKAKVLGKEDALYVIVVPNVASLRKRAVFFRRGRPPFPPIADYYNSAYPFTGHNREYTVGDLKYVLGESGFEIIRLEGFNRSNMNIKTAPKDRFWDFAERIGPETVREFLLAVACKR